MKTFFFSCLFWGLKIHYFPETKTKYKIKKSFLLADFRQNFLLRRNTLYWRNCNFDRNLDFVFEKMWIFFQTLSSTIATFVKRSTPIVCILFSTNRSLTYRLIIDDFPTPESPSKITLRIGLGLWDISDRIKPCLNIFKLKSKEGFIKINLLLKVVTHTTRKLKTIDGRGNSV